MVVGMDQDDPADWSIDRVIDEICLQQSPTWMLGTQLKPVIGPEELAKALRDNDVDGDNLLALEDENLKADLGITSFGRRRALNNIILFLRSQSPKYDAICQLERRRTANTHSLAAQSSRTSLTPARQSPISLDLGIRPSIETDSIRPIRNHYHGHDHGFVSHSWIRRGAQDATPSIKTAGARLPNSDQQQTISRFHHSQDDFPKVQRALHFTKGAEKEIIDNSNGIQDTPAGTSVNIRSQPKVSNLIAISSQQSPSSITNTPKKPKRATLIPISRESYVANQDVRFAEPTDVATHSMHDDMTSNMTTHRIREPLAKRRKISRDAFIPLKIHVPKHSTTNLHSKETGATDIDKEFLIIGKPPASRQGRYYVRAMKQAAMDAHQPYELSQQSMQGIARRMTPRNTADSNGFELMDGDSDDLPSNLKRLLQKYPVNSTGDALPLYGDSEEEDRMMTPESETPSFEDQSENRGFLSKDEIDEIMDSMFEQFKAEWRMRHLPGVQVKAHRKWVIAASNQAIYVDLLNECRIWKERIAKRIASHRKGIFLSEWRKAEDIKQQCLALEVSVHQHEEYCHYVNVLENTNEPPRPVPRDATKPRQSRPRVVLPNGDEELESESGESFIVDDTQVILPDFDEMSVDRHSPAQDQPPPKLDTSISRAEAPAPPVRSPDQTVTDDSMDDIQYQSRGEPRQLARGNVNGTSLAASDVENHNVALAGRTGDRSISSQGVEESSRRNPLALPFLSESSGYDSDFEHAVESSGAKSRKFGRSKEMAIDLTRSGSPSSPEGPSTGGSIREIFTHGFSTASFNNASKSYDSKEQPESPSVSQARHANLLFDIERVSNLAWDDLGLDAEEEMPDRRIALAKCVYSQGLRTSKKLLDYVQSFHTEDDFHDLLNDGVMAKYAEEDDIENVSQKDQDNAFRLTELFLSYATCSNLVDDDPSEAEAGEAYAIISDGGIPEFLRLLVRLLNHTIQVGDGVVNTAGRKNTLTISDDDQSQDSSSAVKRKRQFLKSETTAAAAAAQQRSDQKRVREQEEKKAALARQHEKMGIGKDAKVVAVNFNHPIVYLDPKIAARVKPHQVDGIQFMWREIVDDPKQQGCLLAHTMGLGKTMQVISVLATIAQCKNSTDPAIRQHIPPHLQGNKIMVICPSGLVDNWVEELLEWLPDSVNLGGIYSITNKTKLPPVTVETWTQTGGVLILSYERLRSYTNPRKNGRTIHQNADQLRQNLLEGPCIVIADEAHKLKNPKSKSAQAAKEIRTLSRIALTGSPLNNYLEEYHTMIDWIAPEYLGTAKQFKFSYVNPINRGLYSESSRWERKASLKKLHVLKRNIAPKTNRADITAIKNDLPSKTEFFIIASLTPEQEKAYQLYVEILRNVSERGERKTGNTRVWSWLAVLSLLLNHPSCFIQKLKDRECAELSSQSNTTPNVDDEYDSAATGLGADDINVQEQPALMGAMQKVLDVFTEAKVLYRIEDPVLSNKSLMVKYILEEAVKLGEKTLVFSQSIPTLDYYESMIKSMGLGYKRIDGTDSHLKGLTRQQQVEEFNSQARFSVFLISTRAGGLGLNIQSASRVIINDFNFNPTWEEQAVGRAYRMGQKKPVFVYRFLIGGTFEELIHNKAVFKTQLFTRVVDEKNVMRQAAKSPGEFLFNPKPVPQKTFDDCLGKDPQVLDRVLQRVDCVRNIFLTETFFQDDDEELNEEDLKEANEEFELETLKRDNPAEYERRVEEKRARIAQAFLESQQALLRHREPTNAPVSSLIPSFGAGAAAYRSHYLSLSQPTQPTQPFLPTPFQGPPAWPQGTGMSVAPVGSYCDAFAPNIPLQDQGVRRQSVPPVMQTPATFYQSSDFPVPVVEPRSTTDHTHITDDDLFGGSMRLEEIYGDQATDKVLSENKEMTDISDSAPGCQPQ